MPSPRHTRVSFTPPDLAVIQAERARYKSIDLAPRTISSYVSDWNVFTAWCVAAGRQSLPATEDTVELYATDLLHRGRKLTTAERHCFAIRHHHLAAGMPNPHGAGVKRLLCGARRILAQLPDQKAALEVQDLRAIVRKIGYRTPIRARNVALLLVGFSTALRRSTLAALRPEDIQFTREGFIACVRHEKQNRHGEVRRVAVPFGRGVTCPVRALQRWLLRRGDVPGAIFCRCLNNTPDGRQMHGNRIAQIVQESVALVGLARKSYGAHSMRAGMASEALANGVNELRVAQHLGHASLDTLRLYDRSRRLFQGNAAGLVGL